jgi:hypothetical protein
MTSEAVTLMFKGVCTLSFECNAKVMVSNNTGPDEIVLLLGEELFKVSMKILKLDDRSVEKPAVGGTTATLEPCHGLCTAKQVEEASIPVKDPPAEAKTPREAHHHAGLFQVSGEMVQVNEDTWASPTKAVHFNETGEIAIEESDEVEVCDDLEEEFEESQLPF